MSNTLNPYNLTHEAKEDHIPPDSGQARRLANVGAELVNRWVALDVLELSADFLNARDSARGIVSGDKRSDVVQIAFDEAREFK